MWCGSLEGRFEGFRIVSIPPASLSRALRSKRGLIARQCVMHAIETMFWTSFHRFVQVANPGANLDNSLGGHPKPAINRHLKTGN